MNQIVRVRWEIGLNDESIMGALADADTAPDAQLLKWGLPV